MIRSQIYLTSNERQKLNLLASETGKSRSELIREAIDYFIQHKRLQKQDKLAAMRAAKGLWVDRNDLPNLVALRKEFDREPK